MSQLEDVLGRLRDEPAYLQSLIDEVIHHALERPLDAVLRPGEVAALVGDALRALAASEELESWLEGRAHAATKGLDELQGSVGEKIPITALAPMEKMLSRELVPDPELVHALMDHPSLRELMREVLTANLIEFARRIADMLPGGGRGGRGMGGLLGAVAKNVATGVGGALEKQLEDRARNFVEDALGIAVESTIQSFCDPKKAGDMAKWRVDVFHALLSQPVEHLLDERRKYPPRLFAADAAPIIRAFAGWSTLDQQLEAIFGHLLTQHGETTVKAWLEGSGLESVVRGRVRDALAEEAREFVASDRFAAWLAGLLSGDAG